MTYARLNGEHVFGSHLVCWDSVNQGEIFLVGRFPYQGLRMWLLEKTSLSSQIAFFGLDSFRLDL